jgi:hypothetical protein
MACSAPERENLSALLFRSNPSLQVMYRPTIELVHHAERLVYSTQNPMTKVACNKSRAMEVSLSKRTITAFLNQPKFLCISVLIFPVDKIDRYIFKCAYMVTIVRTRI